MGILNDIALRKIEEAMAAGLFDNLPGKGQPLDLNDDALTPAHLRLGHRVLKSANALPDWVQLGRDIDAARAACRDLWTKIERDYPRRRADAAWRSKARHDYQQALARVNAAILRFNLKAPAVARTQIPFKIAAEMARFDAAFPSAE